VFNHDGNDSQITYNEGLSLDYRYLDAQNMTPRFEFGYGLSYTTFSYSSLTITTSGISQLIKFIVTNTGSFAGIEIPQLYLGYPPSAEEPKKVLRGFEEVILDINASKTVSMNLGERDMRYVIIMESRLGR
jgi:beta-glucosidase